MRLVYEIGLADIEGTGVEEPYMELRKLSSAAPEKHEMAAYLLMLAARKEWAEADFCRELENRRARRQRRVQTTPPPEEHDA